jgi:alpha-amylase
LTDQAATSSTPDFASSFKSLPSATDFHPFCFVKDFNNQTESEQCWLGDDKLALVDVNTEDDKVVSQLHDMATKLVSDFSVDGLRIDTVKHVRKDFWPDFVKAAGVFTMGEVLSNETSYIAPYTEVMDSVLDYSTWFPLVAAFQTSDGDCSALAKHVDSLQSSFKNGQKMTGSFLENHDQPRFPSLSKDSTLGTNALVWPFVTDGIPILYYGQEQGFAGGPDPSNREALWSAAYAQEKPLVKQVKALNLARKAAIGANPKFLVTAVKFPSPSKSQIAVAKPPMLALLTNVGSSAKAPATWSLDAASTGYAPNTDLVDVLSCTKVTTDAKGAVSTTSKAGAPIVLVPASTLAKGGALCGTLATGSSTGSSSSNGTTTGAQPKSSAQGMTLTTSVLVFALSFVGATFALV